MSRVGNYANKTNFHSILNFNLQYWNQKLALALIAHKIFFFRKTKLCDNEVPAFWNSKVMYHNLYLKGIFCLDFILWNCFDTCAKIT